jgi:solute carrier family 8 (sodium/calcium exchanger)
MMSALLRSAICLVLFGHVSAAGFCDVPKYMILPAFGKAETEWPNIIRIVLYLTGLIWTFLGIGVISDVFMGGIEKVTSSKRRFKSVDGRMRTRYVWNLTVANLTLMALGSSAPEILLSLIEIIGGDFFLGDLGAGTIVGSAAFNLLCISAACIAALPDGEVRKIKQTTVFGVTAFFSVFAYLWLMFILMVTSPDVTEIWEGLVTLLFGPLFVFLSYLADKGYVDRLMGREPEQKATPEGKPVDLKPEDVEELAKQIRAEHGNDLTEDQVLEFMKVRWGDERKIHWKQQKVAKKKDKDKAAGKDVESISFTSDEVENDKLQVGIGFGDKDGSGIVKSARVCVKENCGEAEIKIIRCGFLEVQASIPWTTVDGTAKAVDDYKAASGVANFLPGETVQTISIKIMDDSGFEGTEEFYIDLSPPTCDNSQHSSCTATVIGEARATVIVIDDDQPGKLRFQEEQKIVKATDFTEDTLTVEIKVERFEGVRDKIGCKWCTENLTAFHGEDYVKAEGDVIMENEIGEFTIPVTINKRARHKTQDFQVVLSDPSPEGVEFDAAADGASHDKCICTIRLQGTDDGTKGDAKTQFLASMKSVNNSVGHANWCQQFVDAIFEVETGDDDDDDSDEDKVPTKMDYFFHVVQMPWKLLFALVPPVDYCGGWACFFGALVFIAVVTAIVGDLANLVGCCLGINPEITAITFVALGTSLPDTFASMAAAKNDKDADASIGNVTGSNSVNVFLGIGLSWLPAAIFWAAQSEPSADWYKKLQGFKDSSIQKNIMDAAGCVSLTSCERAVFISPAGSIWFNLMVYCVNAVAAIGFLIFRRNSPRIGGELGGPKRGWLGQYQSATFMVCQWFIYVIASSIYATIKSDREKQDFSNFFVGN